MDNEVAKKLSRICVIVIHENGQQSVCNVLCVRVRETFRITFLSWIELYKLNVFRWGWTLL
jgi:hypothetical protein